MERSPRGAPATLLPSPTAHSAASSTSSSSNGLHSAPTTPKQHQTQIQTQPVTRSEPNNPYPTTFVQADTSSFKQVVQMLTGSSETAKLASQSPPDPTHQSKNPIPPIRPASKSKPSRLYERRNSLKNLRINPLVPGLGSNLSGLSSPRNPEILSPSLLDFPALVLSPVTPLIPDPFNRSPGPNWAPNSTPNGNKNLFVDKAAEEKAIAEKGFYLHPSPASTPRESQPPRLLPLFPVTSPKLSGSDYYSS